MGKTPLGQILAKGSFLFVVENYLVSPIKVYDSSLTIK